MPPASTLLVDLGATLYRTQTWDNRAEIAKALGVHQQTVTPWLNYLEFYRAIQPGAEGISVSQDRLLSTIANYRAGQLRPHRPIPVAGSVEEIHDRLQEDGIPHAFCMFSAANRWAFFEPQRDVQLYIARSRRGDLKASLSDLRSDGDGPEAKLRAFMENPEKIATQPREGIPVTRPFQTVVDLRAHPEGGAHADFLETNLLPRLEDTAE